MYRTVSSIIPQHHSYILQNITVPVRYFRIPLVCRKIQQMQKCTQIAGNNSSGTRTFKVRSGARVHKDTRKYRKLIESIGKVRSTLPIVCNSSPCVLIPIFTSEIGQCSLLPKFAVIFITFIISCHIVLFMYSNFTSMSYDFCNVIFL